MTTKAIDSFDFPAAAKRLAPVLSPTHLFRSDALSDAWGNSIYLKPENLQTTGSFKIRGAYNKVAKLSDVKKKKGLITASAGNHAQGVAYAAQHLGVDVTIVMPKTTPFLKVDRTRQYGARVVLAGNDFDEANAKCQQLAKENGYTLIPPFDDPDVIEGQGTIGLEVLQALPEADVLLVPVGGGGLIAGIAACVKAQRPSIRIIGVESVGYDSMHRAIARGAWGPMLRVKPTIADGTAVQTPGKLPYAIARELVDDWFQVTDYDLMACFVTMVTQHKLIVEPSGLLALAAARLLPANHQKVVCILSGGNIDILTISDLINKGMSATGRIVTLRVNLSNRPGALVKLLSVISQSRANIIKVEHDLYKTSARYEDVGVSVTVQTNGSPHIDELVRALEEQGYLVRTEQ